MIQQIDELLALIWQVPDSFVWLRLAAVDENDASLCLALCLPLEPHLQALQLIPGSCVLQLPITKFLQILLHAPHILRRLRQLWDVVRIQPRVFRAKWLQTIDESHADPGGCTWRNQNMSIIRTIPRLRESIDPALNRMWSDVQSSFHIVRLVLRRRVEFTHRRSRLAGVDLELPLVGS